MVVLIMLTVALSCGSCLGQAANSQAATEDLPQYLKDRGIGIPTSMFGTYVRPGELLFYPFFEYYLDDNMEYKPQELGFGLDQDFRGRYRASEGLVFLGYGLTRNLAIETEAAIIDASLEKSSSDPSTMPAELTESGLGDVQTQLDWRWLTESAHRPEIFSFAEIVYPFQKGKILIGTSEWEVKVGTGVIRGFSFGTLIARAAVEYTSDAGTMELGEMAVEYLKRLSRSWRIYLGVEGVQDEIELIIETQWHLSDRIFVKLNNAFGVT